MPVRPCLDCNRLGDWVREPHRGHRCPECRAGYQHRRAPSGLEARRRAEAVRAHREEHGDWCPGYGVDPHPATDLTADHVVPTAAGGPPDGELAVLCRACNSRKADAMPPPPAPWVG